MDQPTPPPDPTAVTPQPADASLTNITTQPSDDPRWMSPRSAPNVSNSTIPILTVGTLSLVGMCVLGALLGTWVGVFAGLIVGLLVFHYFAWGWLYTRMVAEQQKAELLKAAEEDPQQLSDPRRSRHL